MRGILITLEGIDGTGKSTVASKLALLLSKHCLEESEPDVATPSDRQFVFTAEPTDGEIGRLLRKHQMTSKPQIGIKDLEGIQELFLFMADHADHLARIVIPALMQGCVVISDRYTDSRVAYQGVMLENTVPEPIKWIREMHQPWSVSPNLTFLFTMDPGEAYLRCLSRSESTHGQRRLKDPEDETTQEVTDPRRREIIPVPAKFEEEKFLRKVQKNFEEMARLEPDRFVLIDASAPVDDVARLVFSAISDLLREIALI